MFSGTSGLPEFSTPDKKTPSPFNPISISAQYMALARSGSEPYSAAESTLMAVSHHYQVTACS